MAKLPLVAPTITLLTREAPMADLSAYGQAQIGASIMNVSVMPGFPYGDCAKNGFTTVVTARGDRAAAQTLATEIISRAWAMRPKFKRGMTTLEAAVSLAVAAGRDASRPPIVLADVGDNPGGGSRGNTTYLLRALIEAGAQGVLLGVFNDAALAAEAHKLGEGARFRARFNRDEADQFSKPLEAEARVIKLGDGKFVGRRGLARGMALNMGPCCALDLGGITVVVISYRQQCLDPMQFESLGQDIGQARVVVVKSRGHFRSGFDEFFSAEQTYEVDCPGLTSPNLASFPWTRLPRPVYPLDEDAVWAPV